MKVGKSLGMDGFLVENHKKYMDIITPILTNAYSESFEYEALILQFLKKGRDVTDHLISGP